MTPSAILSAAADLLDKPGAWTRKELARDAAGTAVLPTSPHACAWCAVGAMAKVSGLFLTDLDEVRRRLGKVIGECAINLWNDAPNRSQAEVVGALRKAAAL